MLWFSRLRMSRFSDFRGYCASVILACAMILSVACRSYAGVLSDAPPSPLELQIIGSAPSAEKVAIGLRLINHADHAIRIQRGVEVDQGGGFKWTALMMIQAVADCGAYDQSHQWRESIRIEAGAIMDITPWHGGLCGEKRQCAEGCSKNAPAGPGSYRFVVLTSEGDRLPSPSFNLPAM